LRFVAIDPVRSPQGVIVTEQQPGSQDLLRRWQAEGDVDALDELLRTEVRAIKDLISARGRDLMSSSASASDIAQEAVLRMLQLESVPTFSDPNALRGYLWVTAWRLLLQRVRRPYRRKKKIDVGASSQLPPELIVQPEAGAESAEAASALELALNLLPQDDRDLLHLVYFDDRRIADVAREKDLSESAVKMRLLRARRALAARLAAWEEVIGA
jgi:RNA polymerase sigma factor (sigma-70 family)